MIRWGLLVIALVAGLAFAAKLGTMIVSPPLAVDDAPRRAWTVAWFCWVLFSTFGFIGIEGLALRNDTSGDTLTAHLQYIAGQSTAWLVTVAGGILAFFVWFMSHLFGADSRVWKYRKDDGSE